MNKSTSILPPEKMKIMQLGISEVCSCGHLRILHLPADGPITGHGRCWHGLSNKKMSRCLCAKFTWVRNV